MNKPTQRQMVLPILEALSGSGGRARTCDIYEHVADRLNVPESVRTATVTLGDGHVVNHFERSVRWAAQRSKFMQLAAPDEKPYWRITEKGEKALSEALPGVVVTVFTTPKGIALWANCEDAVAFIDAGSLNLIFTSPPYPLLRQKSYGNVSQSEYVDWLVRLIEGWMGKLAPASSIVLNLGDVYEPLSPTISLYQERLLIRLEDDLGLKLCQRFAWLNPSRLPSPASYVTVRRVRCKGSLEQVYWLSPFENPQADNRQVLRAYSDSMLKRIAAGGEKDAVRPSGHIMKAGRFATDNGGSIPDNLLVAANTDSSSGYIRKCREMGLPVHPARFPEALPEFFLKFLTKVGDTVFDPFGGSGKTGEVCERLGRFWITSERVLEYVKGHALRFGMVV